MRSRYKVVVMLEWERQNGFDFEIFQILESVSSQYDQMQSKKLTRKVAHSKTLHSGFLFGSFYLDHDHVGDPELTESAEQLESESFKSASFNPPERRKIEAESSCC